jgi:hypothetical protein
VKGALHVHTTFSDGEFSLEELRLMYTALGYRFACLTDHAESFDERKLTRYRAEADSLSDESFRFIPGLEFECPGRIHILGLGMTSLLTTREPYQVIRSIEEHGSISVIAHPRTKDFGRIEGLEYPPTGIEVWNSKYDGRYAPRIETFELLRRVRDRNPHVRAFYGQDLHFRKQYTGVHVELRNATLDSKSIISALREGRYVGRSADLHLTADGSLEPSVAKRFERLHRRSRQMRGLAGDTKGVLDSLGLSIPARLKTQLRRLF